MTAVDHHDPRDRPIGPSTVRRSGNNHTPRVDVTAAVARMHERNRKVIKRRLLTQHDVLLAGSPIPRDQFWWYRRLLVSLREAFDQISCCCIVRQTERKRDARQRIATITG